MIWLYRLLFWPVFVLMLPKYAGRLAKRGGNWRIGERFGRVTPPVKKQGVKRLWIQAASVGEVRALRGLIDKLAANKAVEIVLSVTTTTGYKIAEELYSKKIAYLFTFPMDILSGQVLRKLGADEILLMEVELWPELLAQARQQKVPVALINARMSDRSFKRLARFPKFSRWMLGHLSHILASSNHDAERYIQLGANRELVMTTGNLKFDAALPTPLPADAKAALWASLGWSSDKTILLGSSTWAGEEEAMINAFKAVSQKHPQARLLLVPRHAERGNEVEELLKSSGLTYSRRSRGDTTAEVQVVLADTTGELGKLTELASLVFIGKSLPPHTEGQTPIEAAAWGKPILFGRGMSNFPAVSRGLADTGAARWVAGPMDLREAIGELMEDPARLSQMGEAAREVFEKNRGATQRTLEWLELATPVVEVVR